MSNKVLGYIRGFLAKKTSKRDECISDSDCTAGQEDDKTAVTQNSTDEIEESVSESYAFTRLRTEEDRYYIISKRIYKPVSHKLRDDTVKKVFEFAYEMSFGGKGEHRSYRSGGSKHRQNGEIFVDAFQGKLAECALFNIIYKLPGAEKPDFSVSGLGVWEDTDLEVCGKTISVKSTKHFGRLMLLEEKDWGEDGTYKPNEKQYDYLALVRIRPSCEQLMKDAGLFEHCKCSYEELRDIICSQKWDYDYAGYISLDELKYIISNGYILPKGALLNGRVRMDASNYYVQAGDMHIIDGDDWIQRTEE